MKKILHLDSSVRESDSLTRTYSARLTAALNPNNTAVVTHRNIDNSTPLLNGEMVQSYFTSPSDRSAEAIKAISASNSVLDELNEHDTYVIGIPMYNFAMPAAFKAWADLAARVGKTFRYTENGPVGLLHGKRAYLVVASGGTPLGSEIDFLTPWLKQFFRFIGVEDTTIVAANDEEIDQLIATLFEQSAA